jgi:hypothetical protein
MFRWVYDLTNNSEAKILWLNALEQMGRASSTEILVRFSAYPWIRKVNERVNRRVDNGIMNQP